MSSIAEPGTYRLPWGGSPRDVRAITRCWLPCRFEEIVALIDDAESLPRWCPAVFLTLELLDTAPGVGRAVRLRTKGWLPYVVRFEARVTRLEPEPPAITIEVGGDFEGVAELALRPERGGLEVELDWRVRFRKPMVSALMGVLGPLLFSNHVWTLERAHHSLILELERRRAGDDVERARVPPPPPAAWPRPLWR